MADHSMLIKSFVSLIGLYVSRRTKAMNVKVLQDYTRRGILS